LVRKAVEEKKDKLKEMKKTFLITINRQKPKTE
jgi:hypothetical protein